MGKSSDLTPRELAVMKAFWRQGIMTADDARAELAKTGEELSYPTVANVVRGLSEKGYLKARNKQRPFQYGPTRSFEEVSRRIVGDVIGRLFSGSREAMLVNLLDGRKLTQKERVFLTSVLEQQED